MKYYRVKEITSYGDEVYFIPENKYHWWSQWKRLDHSYRCRTEEQAWKIINDRIKVRNEAKETQADEKRRKKLTKYHYDSPTICLIKKRKGC
jgi:hypothetical protein